MFTETVHNASPLWSFMIWLDVLGNQEFAQNMRTQPGLYKHSGRVASLRRVIVLGVTTKCSHTKRIYLAKTT